MADLAGLEREQTSVTTSRCNHIVVKWAKLSRKSNALKQE